MAIATRYNDFCGPENIVSQPEKNCSAAVGTSFQGRWNVLYLESTGVAVAISGRSGGKVVIKPSFSPLSNLLIYR